MIINLISGPRNVSTALMYSFAQRSDLSVIDEPFYACYLQKTGTEHPGRDDVLRAQSTEAEQVIEQLYQRHQNQSQPLLFLKNMAHHLHFVKRDFLEKVQNIFLIREPSEMILSFIKKIPNPSLRDTAYKFQYQQFVHITEKLEQPPVVIDAANLLKNPKYVLKEVCRKLGIPFSAEMLKWEAGPIEADGVWAQHWYHNVHQSTGFKPYQPKQETVPEQLLPLLETCNNFYRPMAKYAITPSD